MADGSSKKWAKRNKAVKSGKAEPNRGGGKKGGDKPKPKPDLSMVPF